MSLNAEWHRAHPMPKHATFEQRVEWHREHVKACGCRTSPPDIVAAIAAREAAERAAAERDSSD
jgi:hypothetical protein